MVTAIKLPATSHHTATQHADTRASKGSTSFEATLLASADRAGPVDRKVKNPVVGTQGVHQASTVFYTGQNSTKPGENHPSGPNAGIGFGIGRADNGSKPRQYFLAVRSFLEATPKSRLTVSAEQISSDSPIVGRNVPTMTTAFSTQPPLTLKDKLGPVGVSETISPTLLNFRNPSINIFLAGGTNTVAVSVNNRTIGSRTDGGFAVFNKKELDQVSERQLINLGLNAAEVREARTRPIPSIDKDMPTLVTSTLTVGDVTTDGKPRVQLANGVTVTVTFPLDVKEIPLAYKAIIDKTIELQARPDKAELKAFVASIQASPQLAAGFARWEQSVLDKRARAGEAKPDWLHQLGNAVAGGAAAAHLPEIAGSIAEGAGKFLQFLRGTNEFFNQGGV